MTLSLWLTRRWWLLPLLFVVIGGTLAVNPNDPLPIVLGIAAGFVVVAIDWWVPAVLVNGLLVGAYFAVGGDNGPVFFTIVAAAFLAGLRTEVRRWLPYLLGSAVAIWAGLLVRGMRSDDLVVGAWQSFGVGALVAAASAISTSARIRRAALSDRRDRAVADERLRMAQELHDGVGHGLAVIAMQAGAALHVLDTDPARARDSLEAIRTTSRESLDALRAELATMSGGQIGAAAPRRPVTGVNDLPALVDRVRAAGLAVDVHGSPGEVPDRVGETVHAVVQESLTNVLRHADAQRVTITFQRYADTMVLTVADDGRRVPTPRPGMGIDGMRARVEGVGGRLTVGPAEAPDAGPDAGPDDGGFRVRAELPLS